MMTRAEPPHGLCRDLVDIFEVTRLCGYAQDRAACGAMGFIISLAMIGVVEREERVMARSARAIAGWPRLMSAATAAAYCDESSVKSFRRGIGRFWPTPVRLEGKGERWLKDDLDLAIEQLLAKPQARRDLADVF